MRQRRPISVFLGAAVSLALSTVRLAHADVLQWDGNGSAAPNPAGGAGSWDNSNSNWWTGSVNQSYGSGVTPHDAIFGVAGGAVSISVPVAARSVTFNASGYSLSGGTLTLADVAAVIVTNPADTATISSVVDSTGVFTKLGSGTLTLSAAGTNTFTGIAILGGTVSVNAPGPLGPSTSILTIDGGVLQATGSSAINTDGRNFVFGPGGTTFNITNTNNTGLSMRQSGSTGGTVTGPGALVKNGNGTLRFDRGNSTFYGGIVLNAGTIRFNNNNDAGPKDLRMNRVAFNSNTALMSIGGSGSSADASASDLRSGEWTSGSTGNGQIIAATTVVGGFGASGHNLYILALADATYSGSVDNTFTANGGTSGTNTKNGNFYVRGIATQTLTGTTNINNTINVFESSGLKLGGNASVTGSDVNLNLHGGTFTLDNATVNNSNRYRDDGSIEPRGGGKLVLIGNAAGTNETMGALQLGNIVTTSKPRAGALAIDLVHNAGGSTAPMLNFQSLVRNVGRATVEFTAHNGGGLQIPLGVNGNDPRVTFSTAPSLQSGSGLLETSGLPGDVGWATVNGTAFATYGANGITPASTVAFASAGATDNAQLNAAGVISGGSDTTVASLAIAPGAAQSLDITGSGNLATGGILLSGANDFEIRNTGGGTGGVATNSPLYLHVPQATLKISSPITGGGAIVKSGAGTVELTSANTYTGATTINAGVLRASDASLGATGPIELRGGVLEITGGGTFSRNLGTTTSTGSGPGLINWTNTQEDRGGGGFAAKGAPVALDFNGPGPNNLFYEAGGFLESGYQLVFGSRSADAAVTLVDNLVLNTLPSAYNAREIHVIDNPASSNDLARITGVISSDSSINNGNLSDILKTGDGTLELAAANTYLGGTIIAEGTLLAGNSNALGDDTGPYVILGNRGGSSNAALLTNAPVNIARTITIPAGSSGNVSLGGSDPSASTYSGAILMYRDLSLTAATGGTVTFSNEINNLAAATVTKIGMGAVNVIHLRRGNVTVNAGTLRVKPDGTNAGVSRIGAVSVTSGKLDLTDNRLITTSPVGSWNGSAYTDVTGLIASGRAGGNGIVSSVANSNYTALAVARASEIGIGLTATALWAGQTVTGTDTLIRYTYGGDANLDGKLNIDDYVKIDSGIAAGLTGWTNGDFNYDGKVNIDDYATVIDANIGNQNGPFPPASGFSAVTAVPEPAAGVITLLAPLVMLPRRRRRRSANIAPMRTS